MFSFSSVPNSGLSLSAPLFALQVIPYSSPPPVKLSMPSIVESSSEYDLIVVGAGVLGSAAAKAFGSDGRRVLLLERDLSEPDRIVGELLQPGGVNALTALGMEGMAISRVIKWTGWLIIVYCHLVTDCLEDIDGIPCHGYAIYRENEWVHIPYPVNDATGEKAVGKSFHHGRFIQKLRAAARDTKK